MRQANCFKITTASSSLLQIGTLQQQGKTNFPMIFVFSITLIQDMLANNIMLELKKNVLNFGYGANFKYEGMLALSFDRFYVVTKFEMPKVEDLKLTTFTFDLTCSHLVSHKTFMQKYLKHCQKIVPYARYYQKQIEYYNWTAYNILRNENKLNFAHIFEKVIGRKDSYLQFLEL